MSGSTLAIHSGALGDVLLFARLLERLDGPVTLVAGGEKARLLQDLGVVAAGLDFESLPWPDLFQQELQGHSQLADLLRGHDRLISCFAEGDTAAQMRLVALTGVERGGFLPIRPPADLQAHLTALWADLLGMAPPPHDARAWAVPEPWRAEARTIAARAGAGARVVVLHPGSGGRGKCWPLERYLELSRRLRQEGRGVLHVVGPVEQDLWARDGRLERLAAAGPLAADLTLAQLAGLLAEADAFVGNDSGVAHLAAAVGARTLVLFGPSNPVHFRPLGPRVDVLAAPALEAIDVDHVLRRMAKEEGQQR